MSARAAAEQGMPARAAAAQTHWSSPHINFVQAYVEVTRDVPAWAALHTDAEHYRDELTRDDLAPLLDYLQPR